MYDSCLIFVPFRKIRSVQAGMRAFSLWIVSSEGTGEYVTENLRRVVSVSPNVKLVRRHECDSSLGVKREGKASNHLQIQLLKLAPEKPLQGKGWTDLIILVELP